MGKKLLMLLGMLGVLGIAVREFPSLVREIKIWRMGAAPQGPARRQWSGGG
jgi:hypothetical protein